MPKVKLTADTLQQLGEGYSQLVTQKEITNILADIKDRGHDGKKRKLVVTYTFDPSEGGDRVEVTMTAKATLPAYQPPATAVKFEKEANGFVFNPEVADNPDQQTFTDLKIAKIAAGE